MAVTKVAAFVHSETTEVGERFTHTPETDLIAALMFLNTQLDTTPRFTFFAQVYVPLYLVHVSPGRSLLISGIGEPEVIVHHVAIPPLSDIQGRLQSADRLELVPDLLAELKLLFENQPSNTITIKNALLPRMIEPLKHLTAQYVREPPDEACIETPLSSRDIHDLGILFRTELARLESNISQMDHAKSRIDEFTSEQLRLLDKQREQIIELASQREGQPSIVAAPSTPMPVEKATRLLEAEKRRISLEAAQLLSRFRENLRISAEQCQRLESHIRVHPTDTERILTDLKTRLTQLQTTSQQFNRTLQQAFTELENYFTRLEEAEQRWLWSRQSATTHPPPAEPTPSVYVEAPEYVAEPMDPTVADKQLANLISLRNHIIGGYSELKRTFETQATILKKQFDGFQGISAPANALQGYLPLIRLVIPVFIAKVGDGDGKYGVIPPLRLTAPSSIRFQVEIFDEPFGDLLRQLLRTEIRNDYAFRIRLDHQASMLNWLTRSDTFEGFHRGIQQMSESGLLTQHAIDKLTIFWLSITKQ